MGGEAAAEILARRASAASSPPPTSSRPGEQGRARVDRAGASSTSTTSCRTTTRCCGFTGDRRPRGRLPRAGRARRRLRRRDLRRRRRGARRRRGRRSACRPSRSRSSTPPGCGDAFSAGFLRGLSLGRDRADAARARLRRRRRSSPAASAPTTATSTSPRPTPSRQPRHGAIPRPRTSRRHPYGVSAGTFAYADAWAQLVRHRRHDQPPLEEEHAADVERGLVVQVRAEPWTRCSCMTTATAVFPSPVSSAEVAAQGVAESRPGDSTNLEQLGDPLLAHSAQTSRRARSRRR